MFRAGRFISFLLKAASLIGALCIVLMMLNVTADVTGRYLFNAPLPGTTVFVANFYMIILVFLAIGVAEEKKAHISVEFLTDMMPKRVQGILSIFSGLLTVAVIGLVFVAGWTEAVKKTDSGATVVQGSQMLQVWPSYWLIPIGAAFMATVAAYRVITKVTGQRSGLDETTEQADFFSD